MYKVYMHKFPNNKVYIGITKQKTSDRWKKGNGYKDNIYLVSAIKKYGWDNIEHIILYDGLTQKEAEQKEIELIIQYNSNDRNYGYNIQNGGNSIGKIADETKIKISNKLKGRHSSLKTEFKKGRIHIVTDEMRKKISKSSMGKPATSGSFKKGHISYTLGTHLSEETKEKIREANSKKVMQFDKNFNYIKTWDSIKKAEDYYKINNITSCCKGVYKTSGGYIWRYESEVVNNDR